MPCLWDIPIPFHSVSKVPVYHGVNIETDIFMSPRHKYLLITCVPCPWDTLIPINYVSQFNVYLSVKFETDDIFMSPGHILVHVHTNRAMSLGHTGNLHSVSKFLLYNGVKIKTGTNISSCSYNACYVPGTHQYLYNLYLISLHIMA